MFFRPKDRETLRQLRRDVDEVYDRLAKLNQWLDDAESLYEKMRTLNARLAKRDTRASGEDPTPDAPPSASPSMNPLALRLLQQGHQEAS